MSNVSTAAHAAAAFAFLAKAIDNEFDRDSLPDGSTHSCRATVAVEVDGQSIVTREFDGNVAVGHAAVRASSVGVKSGELLAYVTSKLNAATREALYRELADVFTANAGRLPVTDAAIEEADAAIAKLRQKVDQPVKASVRVNARRVDVDRDGKPVVTGSKVIVTDLTAATPPDAAPSAPAAHFAKSAAPAKSKSRGKGVK